MTNYILEGHTTVKCDNLLEWAEWLEKADKKVARTEKNGIRVSTVFLGIDHSFGESGPPILFETMVFGGKQDGKQERYATWEQAALGHVDMCKLVGI